jgi:hypothetical protein
MDSIERRAYDLFEKLLEQKAKKKLQIEVYGKVT